MDTPVKVVRGARLDSLTGARFVAAGLVFASHVGMGGFFRPGSALADGSMTFSKSAAAVGVSFFFILSGFVLTWSARPGDTYGRMLRRRLVRIFPNHVSTFALAMVVSAATVTPPGVAVLNFLLLQAWSPDWSVYMSVNYPSWSLSCELFFYALFPVLLPLLGRIGASRLWWWAGAAAGTVMALPLAANLLPAGEAFPPVGSFLDGESTNRMWFVYVFPAARLVEFVLGILAARIVISGRWIGLRPGTSGALAVIACVIAAHTPQMFTAAAVTVVPLALLVASLAHADATGARTPLATPLMRRLGEVSFAFYLIHAIVLTYAGKLLAQAHRPPSTSQGITVSLLALAASLCAATAMHRWIEMPAVRRWSRPRTPAVPALNAPAPNTAQPPLKSAEGD